MMTTTKRLLHEAWRKVPGKGAVARAAALAPPTFKQPRAQWVLTRLIESHELAALGKIETNLGLAIPPVTIGGDACQHYFFGTPETYVGERGALLLARCLSARSDGFIDVGANRGYFVYYVGHALAGTLPIHYFEPIPALFDEVEGNVRRMALRDVHGHPCAIGDRTGEAAFYLDLSDPTCSSLTRQLAGRHVLQETRVQVSTFDDFMDGQTMRNACVKVDIENAELAFLAGARRQGDRIAFLIIEILAPAIRAGFVNMAREQLGMHAYYIDDLTLRPSRDGTYSYHHPNRNWLFCRQSPDELRPLLRGTPLRIA